MTRASTARGSPGFRTALVAAAALALAACGGSSSVTGSGGGGGGGGGTAPSPSADVVIDMQSIAYHTSNGTDSITVDVGSTVQWVNLDQGIQHTATSDSVPAGASTIGTGLLSYNEISTVYTVSQAGRYVYHCQVHPNQMVHALIIAR